MASRAGWLHRLGICIIEWRSEGWESESNNEKRLGEIMVESKRLHRRLEREKRTAAVMVEMYCHAHHGTTGHALCDECQELLDYLMDRIRRCPFGKRKPPCPQCTSKCYPPKWNERVRTVMRYSGPRMMKQHPILALWHLWDGHRKHPEPVRKESEQS